jgi:hypothetical protein
MIHCNWSGVPGALFPRQGIETRLPTPLIRILTKSYKSALQARARHLSTSRPQRKGSSLVYAGIQYHVGAIHTSNERKKMGEEAIAHGG